MNGVLNTLEAERLITDEEALVAYSAEELGAPDHTIGCEFELMAGAIETTPKLIPAKKFKYTPDRRFMIAECRNSLAELGFGTDNDGLYEIKTPAAQHPVSLSVATRGLIRAGFLPDQSGCEVTTHISVGTQNRSIESQETKVRLINLLRLVEMSGGSTVDRLVRDPKNSYIGTGGWNYKGRAGIETDAYPQADECRWEGNFNGRVEFRSLAYVDMKQFEQTLDSVFFLSRALLSENEQASDIYAQFEAWFEDYRKQNYLSEVHVDKLHKIRFEKGLSHYIEPFAEHMEKADLTDLKAKTAETVDAVKAAFDAPAIELPTTNVKLKKPKPKNPRSFRLSKVI